VAAAGRARIPSPKSVGEEHTAVGKTKDKEAEEEVEGQGIDTETSEMLENEVKKGKARKFILICKGATIKKLIVFKKGPYNTRLQKAKKDGFRGEAVCGIVTGSGENLRFQLAGTKEVAGAMSVDAPVDSEPTKTTKLKEFLADNNLKRKPEYEIIRDVNALEKADEDDDGAPVAKVGATTTGPTTTTQPSTDGAKVDTAMQEKCKQIKAVVVPRVKEAIAANPSKQAEIVQLVEKAKQQETSLSFGDAFETLKTLAETIKQALGVVTDKVKYDATLPGCEFKVKMLKDHPQTAAIKPEFDVLEGYLKKAKEHAGKNEYAEANKELAKLEKEYPEVKELADKILQYRRFESGAKMRLENLKLHQGKDAIDPAKIAEIESKFPDLDAAIDGRDFNEARKILSGADGTGGIGGKMATYKTQANKHGDYVGLRNNALLQVKALESHPNTAAVTTEIAAIKKDFIEKAKTEFETNNDYEKARALLGKVDKAYNDAKKKADKQGTSAFKTQRDEAKKKFDALCKSPKDKLVAAQIASIKAKLAKSEAYAGTNQFPEASALLAEVTKDCEEAEKLAAQHTGFNDAEKAAAAATGKVDKDTDGAVAAVQKLHDQLKTHPHEPIIRFELGEVQKKIDKAKSA
jgi:hypothetical protein